jgi:hypothetical protein
VFFELHGRVISMKKNLHFIVIAASVLVPLMQTNQQGALLFVVLMAVLLGYGGTP